MLTVMEMLSHPTLKDFRLVTDRSGLDNRIRNSGVLEWESGDALDENFFPGDFVVTTLTAYRDDPDLADLVLMALLEKNLAALAIRDIYFSNVPEEIVEFANEKNTPIFMFTEANTDDIIYAIRNELSAYEINQSAMNNMRHILYQTIDETEIEIRARSINPYFSNNLISCFLTPHDIQNREIIINDCSEEYRTMLKTIKTEPEASYSVLFFSFGIALIYTDTRRDRDLKTDMLPLFEQLPIDPDVFSIGYSDQKAKLSDIGLAVQESIYASIDAAMNETATQDFSRMGITRVLCPLRSNYWVKTYYENLYNKINEYDKRHDTHLYETMEDYVHCDGDINKAAEKSFQHANTIRYRLRKIQELLGIENAMDIRIQLFTLVRLHEIDSLLLDWEV